MVWGCINTYPHTINRNTGKIYVIVEGFGEL